MRKFAFLILSITLVSSLASASQCEPLSKSGEPEKKVDLLLVAGENYDERSVIEEDFNYYTGSDDRGLFDVFPMNVTQDRFNIWYVEGRNNSSTTSGDKGPFREAEYWLNSCAKMDYSVFLAKIRHDGWRGGAYDKIARVDGVGEKVDEGDGAVGLIHEWGHLFGNVADEYNYQEGLMDSTSPNCAESRSQAEEWWGEMASLTSRVGYESGCKGSDNIEAHPGGSIMGDGGLWSYGPVNDRQMLQIISEKTGPVTDISLEKQRISDKTVYLDLKWEKASNVAKIKVEDEIVSRHFLYHSGEKEISIKKPDKPIYNITVETEENIEETSDENSLITVGETPNTPPEKPENLKPGNNTILNEKTVELSATYSDPNQDSGKLIFYNNDNKIGECSADNGEECSIEWKASSGKNTWYVKGSDGESKGKSSTSSFTVNRPPEITVENSPKKTSETKTTLKFRVFDPDENDEKLNLSIYNALNHVKISEKQVNSGETTKIIINRLKPDSRFRWYAKLSDNISTAETDTHPVNIESRTEEVSNQPGFELKTENLALKTIKGGSATKEIKLINSGGTILNISIESDKIDVQPERTELREHKNKSVMLKLDGIDVENSEIKFKASNRDLVRTLDVETSLYENYSYRSKDLEQEVQGIENPELRTQAERKLEKVRDSWQNKKYEQAKISFQEAKSLATSAPNQRTSRSQVENISTEEKSENNLIKPETAVLILLILFILFTLYTSIVPEE